MADSQLDTFVRRCDEHILKGTDGPEAERFVRLVAMTYVGEIDGIDGGLSLYHGVKPYDLPADIELLRTKLSAHREKLERESAIASSVAPQPAVNVSQSVVQKQS